ncbi:hypothetical protein B6S59_19310 [Pseudomonas sp. A46]|nr:hypothetical protein [Pseudomonas sp. A46]OWJ92716.1 hypothetical protein B6S59_19310 [Pseudomonas sp. A46]
MEVFFFLAILIGFVWAVLGSRDQARALGAGEPVGGTWHHMVQILKRGIVRSKTTSEIAGPPRPPAPSPQKPFQPLTERQRSELKLKERHANPHIRYTPSPLPLDARPAKPTRAIRKGWNIGKIEFAYADAKGDISYRRVTVHSVTATYIKGECHVRKAERTFRIDRIIGDITDCETGEILRAKKWARKLSRPKARKRS